MILLDFNRFGAMYSMIKSQSKSSVLEALFCNKRTGEYEEPTHVLVPARVKVSDWLMVFHKAAETLAKDKEIGLQAHRILWYVLSHVEYENRLLVTQADVREALKMKQADVSRAFKLLVKKEILIEVDKIGTCKIYCLNPYSFWKGAASKLKKGLQDGFPWKNDRSPQEDIEPPSNSNLGEKAA